MASAYTRDQVVSYLDYIGLPKDLHNAPPTLDLLKQLHTYTISKLPYENLSLHYNPSHSIDLDPQQLFAKIVTNNRGRGGFCMEIALLEDHIYGKIMLVNHLVRRNLGGKTETVQTLETEKDRVDALKHWFEITLTEDEKTAIKDSAQRLAY
ncbi:hypothetical protein PRZ48_003163 [Zasmidium cellare]|uniref:Arylamine N-acetyltransferase n=1 Tax=Zasmidium cellare TaxID=395010 RepID=A0ABR0EVT0_ZASCE|nr:hypothetical protein PRZ48_003163 [Zasmidium cellare]